MTDTETGKHLEKALENLSQAKASTTKEFVEETISDIENELGELRAGEGEP